MYNWLLKNEGLPLIKSHQAVEGELSFEEAVGDESSGEMWQGQNSVLVVPAAGWTCSSSCASS